MLRLDDEECYIDEPVRSSIKQTRSLGRKQSCVRWLPECSAGAGIVATGTWDEPSNCVQLWAVALQPEDVEMDDDAAAAASEAPAARLLATAHHAASVLGLTAAGGGGVAPPVVCAAGSDGSLSCFSAALDAAAPPSDAAAGPALRLTPAWSDGGGGGGALLSVDASPDGLQLASCGEGGLLSLHDAEGGERLDIPTEESCLFSAEWCSPNEVLTAGACVSLWDKRDLRRPTSRLLPSFGTPMSCSPQLQAASRHPQHPHRVAAGASSGALYGWDLRLGGGRASDLGAHGGDVWCVAYAQLALGDLLSCSSDGTLVARAEEGTASQVLVALEQPINSFHVSPLHGGLAAASDAEVLTFIDLRAT